MALPLRRWAAVLLARHPAWVQGGYLFVIDGLANLVDYLFHIYLGRALAAGAFATVQTANAAALVVVTAFSVSQPVVARYMAAGEGGPAYFRYIFRRGALAGLLLTALVLAARESLGRWLNVAPIVVATGAAILLLSQLRPVVAGALQGQQRFVAYGLTRIVHAAGRLALAVLFIGGLGGGAVAAVATLPLGAVLATAAGLLFLGTAVWQGGLLPDALRHHGWQLLGGALVAYAAYMSLLNADLIWVNRSFDAGTAATYATAVLLRRALALLPGAVVVLLYPRLVATVHRGQSPDRLLALAAVAIVGPILLLTGVYLVAGPLLIRLTFGTQYEAAVSLLGIMGLAMVGYGLATLWLNAWLATRPAPFVLLLALTALAQQLLLARYHATLAQVTTIFAASGWFVAIAGAFLYLLWLRPRLRLRP
jgi:hypothetical protein